MISQKLLKIYPLPQEATVNDVSRLLQNFKLQEIKIKNEVAYAKFSDWTESIKQQLEKQFPNGYHDIEGWKFQITLIELPGEDMEINESEITKHETALKSKAFDHRMESKRSMIRKHTIETNLPGHITDASGINLCLSNNVKWAEEMKKNEPEYFTKLLNIQKPKYLWIGCADSRVPANQIVGLKPGELFVHRNVANIVSPSDINALAVIQYAVQYLGVQDIIVTGHYGCGGVKACFSKTDFGLLEAWLANLRQVRARYHDLLDFIDDENDRVNRLVELNVQSQVLNLSRIPIIQKAWKQGKKLRLHGLVYRLEDGILHDLKVSVDSILHIPEQYRILQ